MKNKIKFALAVLALGASALVATAQDDNGGPPPDGGPGGPGGQGKGKHHPPAPLIVKALDVNHDGIIDSNEIANASAELLTLDKNGDGKLTWDEYMGTNAPPGMAANVQKKHHHIPPIVAALDVNHDGIIDSNEIANASAELLTLDKNGDGQLTPDEFMGPRPHHGPQDGNDSGPGNNNDGPPGPPPSDQ